MLAHLPLTLVCLDGLGNLSEKHPVMAQQAVSCLRYLSLIKIGFFIVSFAQGLLDQPKRHPDSAV